MSKYYQVKEKDKDGHVRIIGSGRTRAEARKFMRAYEERIKAEQARQAAIGIPKEQIDQQKGFVYIEEVV